MHYVIGDIHGCYDELMSLLHKIEERDQEASYFFVGDFIDRGPKVWQVLEWMMTHIIADGRYQAVCGNHEDLIIQWYRQEWLPWWEQGGFDGRRKMPETHYDFSKWLDAMDYLKPEKLEPIIHFFEQLPYEKKVKLESGCYRIVHAWVAPVDELESDRREYSIWARHYGGNHETDEIIVHGHTPTISMGAADGNAPGLIAYE